MEELLPEEQVPCLGGCLCFPTQLGTERTHSLFICFPLATVLAAFLLGCLWPGAFQ